MVKRLKNLLKFRLERWIQRGALPQFLLIAGLIAVCAAAGGLLVTLASGAFSTPGEAIWWAFLRLTDPGYLGDDEGAALRTVSTFLTVTGYVLFVGSLVAILTQWLNQTMRHLESGLTPIAIRDHILILGWTNRTPAIIRELILSEGRVNRFLRRRGSRKLRIVVLAEEVDVRFRTELREQLGAYWNRQQIILRSGTSLRIEHLRRVDFLNASVILLPGADFSETDTDARTVKTLMSITKYSEQGDTFVAPAVVAEVCDATKQPVAEHAYEGEIDVVASDSFISRLIAQNVRHSGLSHVFGELLSHSYGNEIYIRSFPECIGVPFGGLQSGFQNAISIGVVRPGGRNFHPILNPPPEMKIEAEDRLVLIARTYEDAAPHGVFSTDKPDRTRPLLPQRRYDKERKILFLGWNHKVPALLCEFDSYTSERFSIDVVSLLTITERETSLGRYHLDRVHVRQIVADYTAEADLQNLDLSQYHNIVFLGSDWLNTREESDARTILGYVLLRRVLAQYENPPEVLVELMDPQNARLFQRRKGEVIISPVIISHVLAHVALRRELNAVFLELFGSGGSEIFFRPVVDYGFNGDAVTFRQIQKCAARYHEIAIGIRTASREFLAGGVELNPPAGKQWSLGEQDEIIVLTTYE